MKKPTKAGKVAELAKQLGGIFVFATRDTTIPTLENSAAEIAKYPFAEFACNSCGTHFNNVHTAGMGHHCVHCGSDDTNVVTEDVKPNIPEDDVATYQSCSSCGTTTIVHANLASLGHIHCSACGTKVSLAAEEEDQVVELDDMEVLDIDDDSILDLDNLPTTSNDTAEDTDTSDDTLEMSEETVETEPEVDMAEDTMSFNSDELPKVEDKEDDLSDEMTVDLSEGVDEEDDIEFASLNKDVVCLKSKQVIAYLSPSESNKNSDVMHTAAFEDALNHTLKNQGLKKVLSTYGFKANTVVVKLPKIVAAKVASEGKTQSDQVVAKLNSVASDFEQSVMIAALGLSRNFFKGRSDPVKAALLTELATLGVKNPSRVIDGVFAAHGASQVKEIISLAKELASKDIEARNGLSDAMDLTKYVNYKAQQTSSEQDDQETDEEETDDTEEVASFATVVDIPEKRRSASLYKSPALASIMGDQPLFN